MVVYAFYIFDRHAECIYSKRWNPSAPILSRPKGSANDTSKPTTTSSSTTLTTTSGSASKPPTTRSKDADDAKLIFGVVFSLRNISSRLGGPDNSFLCYRTHEYKLHYYETLTKMKFVMLTDTRTNSCQLILHQIWATLYVEYVVKNPLSPAEHGGGVGVANELFESALERFVQTTIV